ncbi:hypothetical protein IFM89_026024 [Coptis chinensis]|uniref:N-acetylglucosaminylphosphatidylinositol deacetylase n=1 Tax=Coptis chinensis TaxID=261450 RepID=A0A835M1N1_9MAGN|nr:hypothetical protein IFM89_026024 [Coptis chinensis]
MDWFLVFIFVLLLWVVSLCKVLYASHLSTVSFLSKGEDAQKRKVMLVAAHPDDEAMFFSPTILYLTSKGHTVHILCLSTGNADGKGNVRKEELYHDGKGNVRKEELYHAGSSLKIFMFVQNNIAWLYVTNVSYNFVMVKQDGFDNMWSAILISKIIQEETASQGIDLLITFDSYGISGHRNHRDLHNGIWCDTPRGRITLLRIEIPDNSEINVYGLGGSNDHCLSWLLIYFQLSTSIIRKYSGPIDLWLSALLGSSSRGQRHCLLNEHPVKSFMAMAQHQSQWIWFQELFVVFSSYTYVNTLRRINL